MRSNASRLIDAVCAGRVGDVGRLLDEGIPVDSRDEKGHTSLHAACGCFEDAPAQPAVVKLLLSRQADVNAQMTMHPKCTPLHWAAIVEPHNREIISTLLAHQADMESRDDHGCTPLHWACNNAAPTTALYLLLHGASSRCSDIDGRPPLSVAIGAKRLPVVAALVRLITPSDVRQELDAVEGGLPSHLAPLLHHFSTLDTVQRRITLTIPTVPGRIFLTTDEIREQVCRLVTKAPLAGDYWLEATHPDRCSKLVAISLPTLLRLRLEKHPFLAGLFARTFLIEADNLPNGPTALLPPEFFGDATAVLPPRPQALELNPTLPAPPHASGPVDPEALARHCLSDAALRASYPVWQLDCPLGWRVLLQRGPSAPRAEPALVLSYVEMHDATGTTVGFQFAVMNLSPKVLLDITCPDQWPPDTFGYMDLQRYLIAVASSDTILVGQRASLALALSRLRIVHNKIIDVSETAEAIPDATAAAMNRLRHSWESRLGGRPATAAEDCALSVELLRTLIAAPPSNGTLAALPPTPPGRRVRVCCIATDPDVMPPAGCDPVLVDTDEQVLEAAARRLDENIEEVLWVQFGRMSADSADRRRQPDPKRRRIEDQREPIDRAVEGLVTGAPLNTVFLISTGPSVGSEHTLGYLFATSQVVIPPHLQPAP